MEYEDEFRDPEAHQAYLRALNAMTPEQKLLRVFELSALTEELFRIGLREANQDLDEAAFARLLRERLDKCYNRNY